MLMVRKKNPALLRKGKGSPIEKKPYSVWYTG